MKKRIAKLLKEAKNAYIEKGIVIGKRSLKKMYNSDLEFRNSIRKNV
jgi:hypothetical protein